MRKSKPYRLSLFHPWQDKTLKEDERPLELFNSTKYTDVGTLIEHVAHNRSYMFCNEVLDKEECSYGNELLKRAGTTNIFASERGKVVALRLRQDRLSGYLIPGSTWGCSGPVSHGLLGEVSDLFGIFGYQALSPASLSEKVMRSTFPEQVFICPRPDAHLRQVLLDTPHGGRIDKAEEGKLYAESFTYDQVKAYFAMAEWTPSPFHKPVYFYGNHTWMDAPTAFLHAHLSVHGSGIHPIQRMDTDIYRRPREGEQFWAWLWKEELEACVEKGYTLDTVERGYAWSDMSDFLQGWVEILWDAWQKYQLSLIKTMMVGLPGRFLRKPENYQLLPVSQAQEGDLWVTANWNKQGRHTTDWVLRTLPHMQSAQLTPIGSYIPMKVRLRQYETMRAEEMRGNPPLRSYIDGYTVAKPTTIPTIIGVAPGQYKEQVEGETWIEGNQLVPLAALERAKLPSFAHESLFRTQRLEQIISTSKIGGENS